MHCRARFCPVNPLRLALRAPLSNSIVTMLEAGGSWWVIAIACFAIRQAHAYASDSALRAWRRDVQHMRSVKCAGLRQTTLSIVWLSSECSWSDGA